MTNPFEDETGVYLVLKNPEGQFSIWPERLDVPAGWQQVSGPGGRQEMLDFVDRTWVDMRPESLKVAMGDAPS